MLIIKYGRLYPANLLSHIDTLRLFNRVFRRAGIEVKYSEGFVPHMLLYFTPPLPLGIESICEYVTADAEVSVAEIKSGALLKRLQAACPAGIDLFYCTTSERNPNYAATVTRAEYAVELKGIGKAATILAAQNSFIITSGDKEKNVRPLIYSLNIENDNSASFVLAYGSAANLKIDVLIKELCRMHSLDYSETKILKTAMFIGEKPI